jgi:CHAD domain-containing protein
VALNRSIVKTAPEPAFDEDKALGPRLMTFALEQLRAAHAYLSGTGEDQHVGIHQARKCIRRVRATLALGAHDLGRRADNLDDELGRLCRGMAHLRDAQALVDELRRLAESASAEVRGVLPLAEREARRQRDALLERALLRDPQFAARRSRLLAAQRRIERLGWQKMSRKGVAEAAIRSKRRADKAQRRAKKHPEDDQAWHVYRRRLRRLRQQDTILHDLEPDLRPSTSGLDDHTALGESQDDALLLRKCNQDSPFPPGEQRALLRKIARERLKQSRRG